MTLPFQTTPAQRRWLPQIVTAMYESAVAIRYILRTLPTLHTTTKAFTI